MSAEPQQASGTALRELLRPVRSMTWAAVGIQVIGSVAEIVPFIAIAEIAKELVSGDPSEPRLRQIAMIVVAALGVRALCAGVAIMVTHFADARLQAILRRRLIDRLGSVALGWFGRHSSGEVKKATDDDIHALHYLVAHSAVETAAAITVPLAGTAYLFSVDWRLALVALLPLPLYGAAFAIMMKDSAEKITEMSEGTTRVNGAIVEFVRGIAVVKAFGRDGQAHTAYRSAVGDFSRFFSGWVGPMLRLESLSSIALAPAVVLVLNLGFGLWFHHLGWVDGIDVLTASMVALVIPAAVMTLSHGMQARIDARAAAGRIAALLALPAVPEPADPRVPDGTAVELADVSFSYDDGSVGLDGVSLRLAPGTMTALVGRSGSGKSTLAALVLRFYDVDSGSVRIDGVDVRDIATPDLYARIGFVLQDVRLLHASIAENIALAVPDADRSAIERVARAAQIHDRIMALPRGYDSVVGDDCVLSGGEAQRISIARAMLHNPSILVLDEATAFADPDVEADIQEALARLVSGRTLLVIAHRLETIVGADQIVVLDEGRLVESGSHEALIATGGSYASMWSALKEGRHDR